MNTHTRDASYQVWLESLNVVVYGPKGVLTQREWILGEKNDGFFDILRF